MSGSALEESVQMVRFDVDRVEREVAGVRGRLDSINARITEMQRLTVTELASFRSALVTYQKTASEIHASVVDTHDTVKDLLEQVRVSQEQQGRMLREIHALNERFDKITESLAREH